jgi:hypothetical protein
MANNDNTTGSIDPPGLSDSRSTQSNAVWLPLLLFGILVCASASLYLPDLQVGEGISPWGRPNIATYWAFALLAGSAGTAAWYAWTARYAGIRTRVLGAVATWIVGGLMLGGSPLARFEPIRSLPMYRLYGNENAVLLVIAAGLLVLAWTGRSLLLATTSAIFLAVSCVNIFYNPENLLPSDAYYAMTLGQISALHVILPGAVLLAGAGFAWGLSSRRRVEASTLAAA